MYDSVYVAQEGGVCLLYCLLNHVITVAYPKVGSQLRLFFS